MKSKNPLWRIKSGNIDRFIRASDQFEAWDSLRDIAASEFGVLATAEPDEAGDGGTFPTRTCLLMFRWGRNSDARKFIKRGMELGMPDTTVQDRAARKRL